MQEITDIQKVSLSFENYKPAYCPLVLSKVSAGFPSPAEDYIESIIDLNQELVRHPATTFFVRANGDSMVNAGIQPNATLVVDRMLETKPGDIVVARIGDEMLVKELQIDDEGKVWLVPRNENYKPFEITPDLDFEVWGKVIWSINKH
ncbi:MAG: translesion error-prone DNA polymerase V autoproteolytic subunit [Pyrinomonadaceae bacterium]|nr:translesion error-prone DNA polymerase V autoproteolytic subunit [Pyrinomonadaceae bacterium]